MNWDLGFFNKIFNPKFDVKPLVEGDPNTSEKDKKLKLLQIAILKGFKGAEEYR